MADQLKGLARAALGQGLFMGWGDEIEAGALSMLGNEGYEPNLKRIRNEYAEYSKESPFASGLAEFGGGAIPGVGMMLIPGGQLAGAAQLGRSALATSGRMALMGAGSGAISGAGSADENSRLGGATSGAVLGGTLGGFMPTITRSAGAATRWLRDRLGVSEPELVNRAAGKMNKVLAQEGTKPTDLMARARADSMMGVPSTLANATPGTARLAEMAVARAGEGSTKIEEQLIRQQLGGRERVVQQVQKQMTPGNYFDNLKQVEEDLRTRSGPLYEQAYSHGDVSDPRIMQMLKEPRFAKMFEDAKGIADLHRIAANLRGEENTDRFKLREIYKLAKDKDGNSIVEGVEVPDVRALDYIKKAMDTAIESGYRGTGTAISDAHGLKEIKKDMLKVMDDLVPDYELARGVYSSGAELREALEMGLEKFKGLRHEEVRDMVSTMQPEVKNAFRTGVARELYGEVMNPTNNINAAQKIIGSPEKMEKLRPLFDSDAKFDLFTAALTREHQLHQQAGKILANSSTAKRTQMVREFEDEPGMGQAIADSVRSGWSGALTNMALRAMNKSEMNDKTAGKLADMLMSKDPNAVAAVVQLLEAEAKASAPRALRATAGDAGLVTGTTTASWPAPLLGEAPEAE